MRAPGLARASSCPSGLCTCAALQIHNSVGMRRGTARTFGTNICLQVRLATDSMTPVRAAISCRPIPRATGWSVTAGRGDHHPFSILLLTPALLVAMRNGLRRRGTEANRRPHTAAPAGTPEVSPQRGTSASAAAPALQQEQPVANGQPKEGNNAMARAPRRRRHGRRRGVWFRRKVPTFPVRVIRRSIEGVGEGTTSRDRSVGGG